MVNYQLGKIYRIVCNTTGLTYYGSTCEDTMAKRLSHHKDSYKRYLNGNYGFTTSFEILKNENYEIILVENFPCNSKDQLHARERFYIESNECVNKIIPTRTKKEYREQNKEEIAKSISKPRLNWNPENNKNMSRGNRIWITNNKENKFIKPEDFEIYQKEGFYKGRSEKYTKNIGEGRKGVKTPNRKKIMLSEQHKQNIAASMTGKIRSETHCKNLSESMKKRTGNKNPVTGKIIINNGINEKRIQPDKLEEYVSHRWIKGRK